jgi:hypothetical protein
MSLSRMKRSMDKGEPSHRGIEGAQLVAHGGHGRLGGGAVEMGERIGLLDDALDASGELEAHDEASHRGEGARHRGTREKKHGELSRLAAREHADERTGQIEKEEAAQRGRDGHEQGEHDVEPEGEPVGRTVPRRGPWRSAPYRRPPLIACPMLKMGRYRAKITAPAMVRAQREYDLPPFPEAGDQLGCSAPRRCPGSASPGDRPPRTGRRA